MADDIDYDLKRVLKEIGVIIVPSKKAEIEFAYDDDSEELFVIYKTHKPDGTYSDADVYAFRLIGD